MTQTIRAYDSRPLTIAEIEHRAPAVLASEPNERVSSRYAYVDTRALLGELELAGFRPYRVDWTGSAYGHDAKHAITLRRDGTKLTVGELIEQVTLTNSYGLESSIIVGGGWHRVACENGLVIGADYASHRVRHVGIVLEAIVEAVRSIAATLPRSLETVRMMQARVLTPDEQYAFAERAIETRYPTTIPERAINIDPRRVLVPQRSADYGLSLWLVYNRAQEWLSSGGVRYRTASTGPYDYGQRAKTRAVTGIDASRRLNESLWRLTEGMLAA